MSRTERLQRKILAGATALATVLAGLAPTASFGHARLRIGGSVPPRSTSSGIKDGPCGGIPRGTPTKLVAGQSLTITIDETINHPGYYRIAFSNANDAFPAPFPVPTADTPASASLWVPYIKDLPGVNVYEATVKVPDIECTQCSIQMIQYMTEQDPPTMYYSCADIEIAKPVAPPPSPTPTATPSPDCK